MFYILCGIRTFKAVYVTCIVTSIGQRGLEAQPATQPATVTATERTWIMVMASDCFGGALAAPGCYCDSVFHQCCKVESPGSIHQTRKLRLGGEVLA